MMPREIAKYRSRLDGLFKKGAGLVTDPELQSHWARYLCVLVSGFIEISVREIFEEYARQQSSPSVTRFVARSLQDCQSAKMERILEIVRDFDPQLEASLRRATEGELKDAIDSVVANRHRIAHGESVGMTFGTVSRYYKKTLEVIDLIIEVSLK